ETITAERPLVLVLEDVHWSDAATLDLLAYLGRREPARLLVMGTHRPVEIIVRAHPLQAVKQDLAVHRQCAGLALELLTEAGGVPGGSGTPGRGGPAVGPGRASAHGWAPSLPGHGGRRPAAPGERDRRGLGGGGRRCHGRASGAGQPAADDRAADRAAQHRGA